VGLIFEWDEPKAASNRRKHGIGFDEAATAFGDPFSLTIPDPDHSQDEDRFVPIGESFRNLGLGSHFLAQAIAHAPSIRVDRLIGFVFGHNQPSLDLFQRFGFQRWGELPGVTLLDGVERDVIILGRRVANSG